MSEQLKLSGTSRGKELLEQVDQLVMTRPAAWGDGQILQWLISNAPAIIALIKTIIALFNTPTPTPAPQPGPVS